MPTAVEMSGTYLGEAGLRALPSPASCLLVVDGVALERGAEVGTRTRYARWLVAGDVALEGEVSNEGGGNTAVRRTLTAVHRLPCGL